MDRGVAGRKVSGAQSVEERLVLVNERLKKFQEKGLCRGETSKGLGARNGESGLDNVKIKQAFEILDVPSLNKLTNRTNTTKFLVKAGGEHLEVLQVNVSSDSGHLNNEDRRPSGQSHKRRAKLKDLVTSSRSLRPKSQEKPKVPESIDSVNEATIDGEKRRRGRKNQQQQQKNKKVIVNEFSKNKAHLRYLLRRITYEQNLIDAYSAEGWKGQSLEKLKPEKELQRAKSHIIRYKMKIRELFQRLDQSLASGKLPESLFDTKGEIDSEDIFCAKCASEDLTLDNDIILCDGACSRGFHQFCLDPPLLKEDIPPGDEDWLCPGCDCKAHCIDMLKDFQGSKITITDSWEKIFPEAVADESGVKLDDGSGLISDDSEDDDYDPAKHNMAEEVYGDGSSYFSAPDNLSASLNNEKYLGLPSDDSEDDDFDPSSPDKDRDEQVKQDSSSSDFSSDSEDLGALLEDEGGNSEDLGQFLSGHHLGQPSTGSKEEDSQMGGKKRQTLKDEPFYLMEASVEPVSSKRRVERLDYKKLNDETFGNSSSDSSDEDFDDSTSCDDTTSRERRKTDLSTARLKYETPVAEKTIISYDENQEKRKQLPIRSRRKDAAVGSPSVSSTRVGSVNSDSKRSAHKRLGEATTQRLYASFNENQFPEKAVKQNLAQELGITYGQVTKWFSNNRWNFNHRPQMEPNSFKKPPEPQPTIASGNNFSSPDIEKEESPIPSTAIEEKSGIKTNGRNSGELEIEIWSGKLD